MIIKEESEDDEVKKIGPGDLLSFGNIKILLILLKIFSIAGLCMINILLYIHIINVSNKGKTKKNEYFKVCVCTLGKEENRYIKEFIEHYIKFGVDKIFLYDNNNINGERFEDVINDYVEKGYVEIIDFRGKIRPIFKIMNNCYKKNYNHYLWLIFFEIDEFIHLKDFNNIKVFLNNSRFDHCQKIQLNWKFHTDNNLLHYDNRTLKERFPEVSKRARGKKVGSFEGIKTIIRGYIPGIKIDCIHRLNTKILPCNGFGRETKPLGIVSEVADYEYYYIDHYYSKSTEEFIHKLNKGDALFRDNRMDRIKNYFYENDITKEKIDYIEKSTGLNLSVFRNRIKENKNNNIFY